MMAFSKLKGAGARFRACRAGATAVEFSIVAMPVLLVIFGILEFGRALWTREALQQTAIAGARCIGVVQSGCGTAGVYSSSMSTSFVQSQAAAWGVALSTSNISVNSGTTCAGVAGFAQVTVTYTFSTVVPAFIPSLAAGIPLSATACFPNNVS